MSPDINYAFLLHLCLVLNYNKWMHKKTKPWPHPFQKKKFHLPSNFYSDDIFTCMILSPYLKYHPLNAGKKNPMQCNGNYSDWMCFSCMFIKVKGTIPYYLMSCPPLLIWQDVKRKTLQNMQELFFITYISNYSIKAIFHLNRCWPIHYEKIINVRSINHNGHFNLTIRLENWNISAQT